MYVIPSDRITIYHYFNLGDDKENLISYGYKISDSEAEGKLELTSSRFLKNFTNEERKGYLCGMKENLEVIQTPSLLE